jgi:hypothetical protein
VRRAISQAPLALLAALALASAAIAGEKAPGPNSPAPDVIGLPAVGSGFPQTLPARGKVVVDYGSDGRFSVSAVGAMTAAFPSRTATKLATREHMLPPEPAVFTAHDDTLVFSLWSDAQDGARLKLENGLVRPLIYSAVVVYDDGEEAATTICSVASRSLRVELWPDDLKAVRITGIYDVRPGATVCGYPERGELSEPPPTLP